MKRKNIPSSYASVAGTTKYSLMVILPTTGGRLDVLEKALQSGCATQAQVSTSLVVVAPEFAVAAREMSERFGALIISDRGLGIADATNLGLTQRSCEDFYVWLGDDDELVPSGVKKLVDVLADNPSAVVAQGHCEYIDKDGRVIFVNRAGRFSRAVLPWGPNLIPHPGTVIRLDALEAVGCFDSSLHYALDLDIFLKLRKMGDFITVPAVSARFRWHADSATVADRSTSAREAIKVKKRHLPAGLRPLSWIWNYPVAWASQVAAWAVTARARKLAS